MAGVGVGGGSPLMRGGSHGQPGEVPPLGAGPSVDTMRFVASIKVGAGVEDIARPVVLLDGRLGWWADDDANQPTKHA